VVFSGIRYISPEEIAAGNTFTFEQLFLKILNFKEAKHV